MSTQTLPSLAGLGFDVIRTPVWDTVVQMAISGKETRLANQTYPRWRWDLKYNILRADSTNHELQDLVGFFNARQGQFDTFLYTDQDDNTVTGQALGTGDGATLTFQLVRTFGGFVEPVLAPHTVSAVYVDGSSISGSFWSVSNWGTTTPGLLTFAGGHAPTSGKAVTADFTYYWPVRMTSDSVPFNMFLTQYYAAQKFGFISVKN